MSFRGEAAQAEVAAVAQADRAHHRAIEKEPNCEAGVEWRLGAALPSAHEVSERARLARPIEHLNLRGWKSADRQLCFDLTYHR